MTALIIDDEDLSRQELQFLLEQTDIVKVIGQGSNGIEAVDLIGKLQPDLVFLDVQMPGLDGFAVLKKLLERQKPLPQIVFATAFDQYAVRAFEVNAVDYLLKPFEKRRVLQSIQKAQNRLQVEETLASSTGGTAPRHIEGSTSAKLDALLRLIDDRGLAGRGFSAGAASANKIVVRAHHRLLLVEQSDICFASIDEGAIRVVTSTVQGLANCRTLEELTEQLNPDLFWRAHRSFVVNLQHISEVVPWFKSTYQLRMDDPKHTEIPVSRAQTKRLRELFNL